MFRSFRKPWRISAALAGAVLLSAAAPVAEAGFTAVKSSKRRTEVSHEQILERVYGGNFVADPTGLHFSNESGVTVTRLEDSGAASGGRTDEVWSGRVTSARAVAAFGRKSRTASYFGGTSGGQFSKMIDATGANFDVTAAAGPAAPAVVEGDLAFGRGRKARRAFSSVAAGNRDGMDHMVSYEVKNAGAAGEGSATFLLCWEDKLARRSDRDYNDMVIEIRTSTSAAAAAAALAEPLLIPLPPGVWSGLGGLLGLGAIGAFRRTVRRVRLF